jgi:hypothetical protein
MMAHTVAEVGGPPAEQAPEKDMAVTVDVGGDLATVRVGACTEEVRQ